MIDQLPENRTLPGDVRLRARRRLSEGMNPRPGTRTPLLIAAGVSLLAAGGVVAGQALYGGNAELAGPSYPYNGQFVGKDLTVVNHVERGTVNPDALARCVAAANEHPPAAEWQPIATSRRNGLTLTAFRSPAGVFFCANTATTTTISAPADTKLDQGARQVKVLFTTPTGALAGLASPDVRFLSLSRIGDNGWNNAEAALVDGLFLAPSGYTKAENGSKALVNGSDFALRGVPKPTPSVVDRPLPPADRSTPEAQKLAECLRDRPVPDADQFEVGVTAKVSAAGTLRLGRFGGVLLYCLDGGETLRGSAVEADDMGEFPARTVAAISAFYDFVGSEAGGSQSSHMAAVGLVTDDRVASITYTRPGTADVPASISNGTFVLAAPFIDRHPDARVVVRDATGKVLETIKPRDVP
ncbi:hypothetical protein [Lentzea nigeriaca]|uniref:hypothetical protein n=1 Tax=Lentzea nigeriaca TaxID=1128665 RepID=UPI0019576654|nr:hypothetical protein [Lentzea nigeriaca]MBM7862484.1 hypothetical protein [Lentzea nigeriaca]